MYLHLGTLFTPINRKSMTLQAQILKDSKLSLAKKAELVEAIDYWQLERWKRLKRFHQLNHISMSVRHFFMKKEIELIRSQKIRRHALMNSFYEAINSN